MSKCPRCQGLLVHDTAIDYMIGEKVRIRRCVNCGHIEDHVIMMNRLLSPISATERYVRTRTKQPVFVE